MEALDILKILKENYVTHFDSLDEIETESNYLQALFKRRLKDLSIIKMLAVGSYTFIIIAKRQDSSPVVLKVIRKKYASNTDAWGTLENEHYILTKLPEINSSEVSRLLEVYRTDSGKIFALQMPLIEEGITLKEFIRQHIEQWNDETISPISINRINNTCRELLDLFLKLSTIVNEIHSKNIFHLDIRPENIIIKTHTHTTLAVDRVFLIDYGIAIELLDGKTPSKIQNFSEYTHPTVRRGDYLFHKSTLSEFDIFSIGKVIQFCCEQLVVEFGENLNASYEFRFLNLLATIILHPHESNKLSIGTKLRLNKYILDSTTINNSRILIDKLTRYFDSTYFDRQIRELNSKGIRFINTGLGDRVPISDRVQRVVEHPFFQRLKSEVQLGWIKEVFPNATHTRFSHSLGVYGAVLQYLKALLNDEDNPTLRIIIGIDDVEHLILLALLHDIGQSSFGHDFEILEIFGNHEEFLKRIIGSPDDVDSLYTVILKGWPKFQLNRLLEITSKKPKHNFIDYLLADIISGPIDADKFDYLPRDASNCGIPYGLSFDKNRFLSALTIWIAPDPESTPTTSVAGVTRSIALSYKAKAAPAVESLLISRYQMYSAVYWHHTFRAIISVFAYTLRTTFGGKSKEHSKRIQELFFDYVIIGNNLNFEKLQEFGFDKKSASNIINIHSKAPINISRERAFSFIWLFASEEVKQLLSDLSTRKLYKRIQEFRPDDISLSFEQAKQLLQPFQSIQISKKIEERLIVELNDVLNKKFKSQKTIATNYSQNKLDNALKNQVALILIDFPHRGASSERNHPFELNDTSRKYTGELPVEDCDNTIVVDTNEMQKKTSMIRVFSDPTIHELIVRYIPKTKIAEICRDEIQKSSKQ